MLLAKEEEDSKNGNLSKSDNEAMQLHRQDYLSKISDKTLARYKRLYGVILRLIPGIKALIGNRGSQGAQLKRVTKKINHAINEARSNDAGKLRDKIASYATLDPSVAVISPAIPSGSSRSQLGVNHPVLAGYLCPIDSVKAFQDNPEGTRKKLENGKIKMSANNLPAFLWEENGRKFNEDSLLEGFFCGFYIERVTRHIFTGPSTGMGGDARGSKPNNSELVQMDCVEGAHLAYAAVQARFGISSKNRWTEQDGNFDYRNFYYGLIEMIDDYPDVKATVSKHYNMLLFKDENGRQKDTGNDENDNGDEDGNKMSVLSRMRAQIAAGRASSGPSTRGNLATLDTPPADKPQTVASPPTTTTTTSETPADNPDIFASPLRTSTTTSDPPSNPIPVVSDASSSDVNDVSTTSSKPTVSSASISSSPIRSISVVPAQRKDSPLSDLSDSEKDEAKGSKEKKANKKGKRKAPDADGPPRKSSRRRKK
ncbi:hypothetical protein EV363DRAFT_1245514 [Boletus edulis]|nr:hypothetical protein EV363DRAFT_1245514 [Boletus edulis]